MAKERFANPDFRGGVFALVAPVKPHKLAWELNGALHVQLARQAERLHRLADGRDLPVDFFRWLGPHQHYHLLVNKVTTDASGSVSLLVPGLRRFDYFLTIEDPEALLSMEETKKVLASCKLVLFLQELDLSKVLNVQPIILT